MNWKLKIVKHEKLYKNYKKASQVLNGSEIMMFITSLTIASTGAASVIGNVINIPVSVICTILGLTGKIIVPKLKKKAKKHHIKMNQSDITLNQINNIISRAITNEHISVSEFELMMNEYQKVSEKT
jgi:mannose/fructose/N-acetylgalactosamine-specific phosphotransferase system component IIC